MTGTKVEELAVLKQDPKIQNNDYTFHKIHSLIIDDYNYFNRIPET